MKDKLFSIIQKNNKKIPQTLISFLLTVFVMTSLTTGVFSGSKEDNQILDSNVSSDTSSIEEVNKEYLENVSETSSSEDEQESSIQESNVNSQVEVSATETIVETSIVVKEEENSTNTSLVNDEPLNKSMEGETNEENNGNDERTPLSTVINNDVRIHSNLTVEQLEKGLNYNLKPLAYAFINAEKTYNVNAIVLAAIAAEESGWGRYCYKPYNIFGFYTKNNFSSYEECINYVASFLQRNYLTEGGCYFNGYSLAAVNRCYNGRQSWLNNISTIAYGIEKRACS